MRVNMPKVKTKSIARSNKGKHRQELREKTSTMKLLSSLK